MLVKKAIEISDAKIQFISLVDKAANLRQFLVTKAENGSAQFSAQGKILKVDDVTHYITGVVYEPLAEDAHGNYMTEEEIRKAAYWFAKNGDKVDLQHSFEAVDGVSVVENYVAPCDMQVGDTAVLKGTWLITTEVTNTEVWDSVQKGEIAGFSMGGVGKYSEEDTDLSELSKSGVETPEKVGIFKKLAEAFGFSVVQKGAMLEAYEAKSRSSNFWNAFYTLEDLLYRYNWQTDRWEFETDEATVKEALSEFVAIVEKVLAAPNISKALATDAPLLKAGKKMSSANQKKLDTAYQTLTELREALADGTEEIEKEDITLNKDDIQKMIDEAVAKATTPAAPADGAAAPEALTSEAVQKMIDEAIAKAVAPAQDTPAEETLTAEAVQKMVEDSVTKAVGELRKARGTATNLNDEKQVEKTADVFAGLFV